MGIACLCHADITPLSRILTYRFDLITQRLQYRILVMSKIDGKEDIVRNHRQRPRLIFRLAYGETYKIQRIVKQDLQRFNHVDCINQRVSAIS